MKAIDEQIEVWSESLAERLTEIKYLNLDEMKTTLSVHLKSAIYDCLKVQIPETEKELKRIIQLRLIAKGKFAKILESDIITLRQKRKEQNMLISNIRNENIAIEMTLWMRKYHNESIEQFYAYFDSKFPMP